MRPTNFLFIFIFLILFASCKTAEEIKREKMVDSLSLQVVQGQQQTADVSTRLQEIEERALQLTGKVEEVEHNLSEKQNAEFKSINDELKLINERLALATENSNRISALQDIVAAQAKFIKTATSSLTAIAKEDKYNSLSPYSKALKDYRKGRYKKALPVFESLIKSKRISKNKKARVLHNAGMIKYMQKKYDDSIIYFSKLMTDFPKSGFNANGMLFLGKSLQNKKDKDGAIQTLEELIGRYPKSKAAKKAKRALKKLRK